MIDKDQPLDETYVLERLMDQDRLAALRESGLLDSPAEEALDKYTKLASTILGVPVSLISLVDIDRQFFKSQLGLPTPWAEKRQTPLSHSFCQYVVATGKPLVIEDARTSALVKDNLAIPDLNVIAYAGVPIRTGDGQALGSFCAIHGQVHEWSDEEFEILKALAEAVSAEIEMRRQVQRAVASEVRLAQLLETAPAIVYQIDADGVFTLSKGSGLKALNLSSNQVVGTSVFEFYKGYPDVIQAVKQALAGESVTFVAEVEDAVFDNRLVPNIGDDGKVVSVNGAGFDITEQRQAQAKLQRQSEALLISNRELAVARKQAEEANRLKSEFLATMSHELRTPMNAVIGYGDILLKGMLGPLSEKQHNTIERMLINAEHLLSLINDILDLSKIEAGRLEIVKEMVTPAQLNELLLAQMGSLAKQKNLDLRVKIDDKLPKTFVGDRERLMQILINLVGNAIKFTEEGYVEVRMRSILPDNWALEIEDTGPGIASHALEYIFDEFRQVDGGSERKHNGTGLGLSIVRNLAMMMSGNVRVLSTVGKGSTFIVTLPLVEALTENPSLPYAVMTR